MTDKNSIPNIRYDALGRPFTVYSTPYRRPSMIMPTKAMFEPDYTADGLIDIRVARAESMMDMLHRHMNLIFPTWDEEPVDRCKWKKDYPHCPTIQTPCLCRPGTCEHYEPVEGQ